MNNQISTAYRKINNLLSSGAVTVTGPGQPRILKQKVTTTTAASSNSAQQDNSSPRCYVCDDTLSATQTKHQITEMFTTHTSTKFPNKLGQLVGDGFIVIVSSDDMVCSRCTNLINYWDRLENDVDRVRTNLMNLLHKKYGLNDDGGGGCADGNPPLKVQKLASGVGNRTVEDINSDQNRTRKLVQSSDASYTKQSPTAGAVQQIKIATPVQQSTAGTQTVQRKATKIYKCTSCDYKTSDMRLFNSHFETCKQQTFQCKTCKRIFPNFGAMKQHMVRDHNTPMDNTCAVCHINFVNEGALRKHMEINHATNVLVTSTTTIPAGAVAAAAAADSITPTAGGSATALYTCNHCQFKSTDKSILDEHMRKHLGGKPKPFKCRLCSQRFETREAATVHAKQHQTNYFKCGTCAMSFPKREMLVKHFEVHQTVTTATPVSQTQTSPVVVKQQTTVQNVHTTQKLLQETIDEALSDSVTSAGDVAVTGVENNIRFFSCHICSLTFIQETYYNHHMETHRRDKKSGGTSVSSTSLNSVAAALLSDEAPESSAKQSEAGEQSAEADIESIFEKMHSDKGEGSNTEVVTTSGGNTKTTNSNRSSTAGGDNLVITSQESSGGITFNITIPQPDASESSEKASPPTTAPVSVSIDMPVLDQPDEETSSQEGTEHKNGNSEGKSDDSSKTAAAPVSMPSLDDDNEGVDQVNSNASATDEKKKTQTAKSDENTEADDKPSEEATHSEEGAEGGRPTSATVGEGENTETVESAEGEQAANAEGEASAGEHMAESGEHQVAMELDESMQAQVESGQIKFIVNETGQLIQLDNHIITDADGNQILVQDPEQIQQLLQSVGVLQSGEGLDGETLQMMTDGNGQMVLVQGENNESQLIDASLLNADGQLIIQQGQDENEGPHVISEDGTRIPVSVSYTADGQPIVQVQQQVLEAAGEVLDKDGTAAATESGGQSDEATAQDGSGAANNATASGDGGDSSAAGGGYFTLEEYIPQSAEAKAD